MKFFIRFIFAVATCVFLYACPYSSTHMLDENPGIYVEDDLLGSWATFVKKPVSGRTEPVKMILSKKSDTEYNIAFTGNIDELKPFRVIDRDSVNGTAFMSTVGGKQFFNITIKDKIYIAEIIFKNNMLSVLPLSDHFTAKMIMNNTDLRNSIEFHYKTRVIPLYDEDFCLREMVKVN